jgi:outer membrane protein insertion porin family
MPGVSFAESELVRTACATICRCSHHWGKMILQDKPATYNCKGFGFGILLAFLCIFVIYGAPSARCQASSSSNTISAATDTGSSSFAGVATTTDWEGKTVKSISFIGVSSSRLSPLSEHLAQTAQSPFSRTNIEKSLRQLYATGLYDTIQVEGSTDKDGVALVFRGEPRLFINDVGLDGVKGSTLITQLGRASQLTTGTSFSKTKLNQALLSIRKALAENGFNESAVTYTLTPHTDEQLVDVHFHVVPGPQARVGAVSVSGDVGMSTETFRRRARLKSGSRINHDTTNRALSGVLKHYQDQDRLEAEIKINSQQYKKNSNRTDFGFSANQGPIVRVVVQGADISPERIKRLIPIYEEGTVDEDLLNEGNRSLRDYYQRLGYFDVKVDHEVQSQQKNLMTIVYRINMGLRRRVAKIEITGNHYFDSAVLKEILSVRIANSIDRHGLYSQSLVAADISALQNIYQNNGFSQIKITAESYIGESPSSTSHARTESAEAQSLAVEKISASKKSKTLPLSIVYHIVEGPQQRVGSVQIVDAEHIAPKDLMPLLNTIPGQLLSSQNLSGDRDALLTEYLSRGFDRVQIEVAQQQQQDDPNQINVTFRITEGQQLFVRKILITGAYYTHPDTIAKAITLQPGDPLDESALAATQRKLYDLSLFNKVDTAIVNPSGGEDHKTILVKVEEARRWALTYGLGFEAATGTPQYNCHGIIASGVSCNPDGKTGVSPRVILDITRNNLFGREQSASLRATAGLLEQRIDLLYQIPHFVGRDNIGLSFSGGYASSLDVTTYVSSRLEGSFRWTQNFLSNGSRFSKANTLIYGFDFRRVKVQASSLQVAPGEIEQAATAARVAGPAFTWIRDTRDSQLDAHRGTYTSFQEFFSYHAFGAEAQFNRIDLSNSSYYSFNKNRIVLARSTRYGQIRSFGPNSSRLIPLPERLYAGGATSLRAFGSNSAGPRDPETGYPIGGAGALIESTELRLPPPTLPWIGSSVSFVLFHDMGNVFTNASDAWISALRIHQPDRDNCKDLTVPDDPDTPPGKVTSTGWQGSCNFNYFSHSPGLGLRYNTPVGPIRLDFSYNLNPPIYPIIYDYSLTDPASNPRVGQAGHFNFFFSLGQSF